MSATGGFLLCFSVHLATHRLTLDYLMLISQNVAGCDSFDSFTRACFISCCGLAVTNWFKGQTSWNKGDFSQFFVMFPCKDCFFEVTFPLLSPFKEKSWSVLLIKGYVSNDQLRAAQCANCKSTAYALTVNFGNPNLFLFACRDSKCRHRMLRFDFGDCAICKANATGNWNPKSLSTVTWNNPSCKSYTRFWAYPSHLSRLSLLVSFYADTRIKFGLASDP